MSETKALFTALKKILKEQGVTYKDIAQKLDLSEASVKRLFSQNDVSLTRLEHICHAIHMSLSDFFARFEAQKEHIQQLTYPQEKEIVAEKKLLLVTICVLNHWKFDEILSYYDFSEPELIRYVVRLDQMSIIELQPNNRFKVLVDANFQWLSDGPIQRFFQETIADDFFASHFHPPKEIILVRSGMLSEQDNLLFQQTLRKTANEFTQLCKDTTHIPIDKRDGTALVIAFRSWVPKIFDVFKR